MKRIATALIITVVLTACNSYRVIEREDRLKPNGSDEVHLVLSHRGHKIHAVCDYSTVGNLDPNASCGLRPLQEYKCALGRTKMTDKLPLSDLTCTAGDNNVYLYVSKED